MPWIVQLIIGLVLSAASSLIQSMQAQDKKQVAGVRGTIQTGGDSPLAFIMGFYGTSGHLKYAGAWGNDGDTPNAYLSKVVTVSDLPIRSYAGWFVNGERVTLAATVTGDLGYAVLQYRVAGKDHMWIKPYLGGQTSADPLMRAKFGSDADRPYTSDMIGRGQAYFVATALQNRELFANLPEYFAEVNGIPLDDPRGDNAHDNPIVGIYTLLRGIYYNGVWVYGPQSITTNRLPSANWEAQMDKCDAIVAGAKRFRFGLEVSVDQEPHAVIGELLKACEGRIAEIGGTYKVLVGEPGAPVVSITDEDIVITEGQSYEPFPGLEATFNGVTATYPEPQEAWESKEAPPRYRSDLELLDDNRRLPFSTDYKAVPFPVQVQRLMRAAIEETRRFRRHTKTMPPEWWEFEPLDAYAWSSDRNGYENKLFLITAMDDLPNGNQFVGDQEIDPADYDWSSDYELPWDVAPLVIARPQPQVMTGWQAIPAVIEDEAGNPRRPSIEVQFDGLLVDVRAVRIQVRESWGTKRVIFDGEVPYDPTVAIPSKVLNGTFLPAMVYEVRGIYVPFSGRRTLWSNQNPDGTEGPWLTVETDDIRLGVLDIYAGTIIADLPQSLIDWQAYIGPSVRDVIDNLQRIANLSAEQDLGNFRDKKTLERKLASSFESSSAKFAELIVAATGPTSAIVGRIESLEAQVGDDLAEAIDLLETQIETVDGKVNLAATAITSLRVAMGGNSANVNVRFSASAGPAGFAARYAIQAAVNDGAYRAVGFFMDVPANPALPGRIVLQAQQTVIVDQAGTILALFTSDGKLATARIPSIATNMILAGAITVDKLAAGAVTADKLSVTTLSAITGNMGTLIAGMFRSADSKLQVDANNTRILVQD